MNIYARTAIRFSAVMALFAISGAAMWALVHLPFYLGVSIVITGTVAWVLRECYQDEKERE